MGVVNSLHRTLPSPAAAGLSRKWPLLVPPAQQAGRAGPRVPTLFAEEEAQSLKMDTMRSVVRANMVVTGHSASSVATFKAFLGCMEFWLLRPMQHGTDSHG